MRAMILAAGPGKRMGELTTHTPKCLIKVRDHFLIEYSLMALARAHIKEVVINIYHHKDLIKEALGNGERYGVSIVYSEENSALETGGGVYQALPLLGKDPFLILSADVVTDFSLTNLSQKITGLAHLVLVPNPTYHLEGDFGLVEGRLTLDGFPKFTFGNIGMYDPALFAESKPGYFRLGDVLKTAVSKNQVTGELYTGSWFNVGTPTDIATCAQAITI